MKLLLLLFTLIASIANFIETLKVNQSMNKKKGDTILILYKKLKKKRNKSLILNCIYITISIVTYRNIIYPAIFLLIMAIEGQITNVALNKATFKYRRHKYLYLKEYFSLQQKRINHSSYVAFNDLLVSINDTIKSLKTTSLGIIELEGISNQIKIEINNLGEYIDDFNKYHQEEEEELIDSRKIQSMNILNITEDSLSIENVRKAYRKLCKSVHPDMNQQQYSEQFIELNNAHEYLLSIL